MQLSDQITDRTKNQVKGLLELRQLILLAFSILFIFCLSAQKNNGGKKMKLEEILAKSAEYCDKLEKAAFFFVCQEKIKEVIYLNALNFIFGNSARPPLWILSSPYSEIEKNELLYDYQLIKRGNEIKENRVLMEENGKKKNQKEAPLKTKRFYSFRAFLAPVGLLGRDGQNFFQYRFLGEDEVFSEKTYVLEAQPKVKTKDKPVFGKIWVAKEDFSVLKIEVDQESLAGFEEIEKKVKIQSIKPVFRDIHFFEVKKNNLRFPSKTIFEEKYRYKSLTSEIIVSRTEVEYMAYKFFSVDVEIKYKFF